jgi:hypothetical protein
MNEQIKELISLFQKRENRDCKLVIINILLEHSHFDYAFRTQFTIVREAHRKYFRSPLIRE